MGPIQNAVFSCFRTKRVHQRIPITFQAKHTQRTHREPPIRLVLWILGGTPLELGNRLTRRRLAPPSMSSSGQCSGGEVRTSHHI